MNRNFVIGLVQMKSTTNKEENLARGIEKVREAAKRGAQIICLDELFAGEYFCRTEEAELFGLAEPIPGPTTSRFAEVAKECHVALVVSLFERRTAGVYHNSCAILDADGSYLGKYRKMHIPGRPSLLREVLFHPRRPRFSKF